jgi:hypothetical protein
MVNRLTPNNPYMGRTAPLTSKHCILYICSTNKSTEYFKHALYSPFFSLQNAVCFIMLTCLVAVLFRFYIQDVLKLKKNNSGAKGLNISYRSLFFPPIPSQYIIFFVFFFLFLLCLDVEWSLRYVQFINRHKSTENFICLTSSVYQLFVFCYKFQATL